MKKQISKYILFLLAMFFSFLSWKRVDDEINSMETSNWILSILIFSLLFIVLYLCLIAIKERYVLEVLLIICLSWSFIFAMNYWQLLSILVGLIFALVGLYKIKRDLGLNIKINLGKTLGTGKQYLILAFAIVLSSQYFLTVQNKNPQSIIPNFASSQYSNIIISKVLSLINPEFKKISQDNLTVDEFILETQKNQKINNSPSLSNDQINQAIDQMGSSLTVDQKKKMKEEAQNNLTNVNSQLLKNNEELILKESRNKISDLLGKEVTGQEKMADVFNEIISRKLTGYLQPNISDGKNSNLLPLVLTIILFLTVVPLGSLLNIFWVLFTRLIFWIFVKSGLIIIGKAPTIVEVIE